MSLTAPSPSIPSLRLFHIADIPTGRLMGHLPMLFSDRHMILHSHYIPLCFLTIVSYKKFSIVTCLGGRLR